MSFSRNSILCISKAFYLGFNRVTKSSCQTTQKHLKLWEWLSLFCLLAPEGCLQYLTGITGTFQSFNYVDATRLMLSNTDYTVCIRAERNFCGIQYTACPDTGNSWFKLYIFSLTIIHFCEKDRDLNLGLFVPSQEKGAKKHYLRSKSLFYDFHLATRFFLYIFHESQISPYLNLYFRV